MTEPENNHRNSNRFGLLDLLREQARDLYDASCRFRDVLDELRLIAVSPELGELLKETHAEWSDGVSAIEEACEILEVPPTGVACEAMKGLIRECKDSTSEWEDSATRDAAIIANCQRVVHYGIAGYGTAAAFARCLKLGEAERLFQRLLKEVIESDTRLTKLAVGGWFASGVNSEAAEH